MSTEQVSEQQVPGLQRESLPQIPKATKHAHILKVKHEKLHILGLKDISAVKSTGCSARTQGSVPSAQGVVHIYNISSRSAYPLFYTDLHEGKTAIHKE